VSLEKIGTESRTHPYDKEDLYALPQLLCPYFLNRKRKGSGQEVYLNFYDQLERGAYGSYELNRRT
jgi:hypothetical protein